MIAMTKLKIAAHISILQEKLFHEIPAFPEASMYSFYG
jgi:hypothetical protein